jgi:protein CMS1
MLQVEEQAKLLKLHLCIAVGTPNRIDKLAGMEALQLSKLRLVLVDMQPDVKKRTLLDIPETR